MNNIIRGPVICAEIPDKYPVIVAGTNIVFKNIPVGFLEMLVTDLNSRPEIPGKRIVPDDNIMPAVNPYPTIPPFINRCVKVIVVYIISFYQDINPIFHQNAPTDIFVALAVPNRTIGTSSAANHDIVCKPFA